MTINERFWALVNKTDDCWLWIGAKRWNGYGKFCIESERTKNGKRRQSHIIASRMSYELTYGAFDAALLVCHKCDNKLCVRPDHLFLGTHADNTFDMMKKGRGTIGESNGASKLTADQIKKIREMRGKATQYEIAEQFKISQTQVSRIMNRARWAHV